ncbi:channel protein TolC [Salinisphaera orenii MK-B5]|uniref:Channel protein TolC n=1 Tax=Salinisphaera orenii MK-B5 TaxID=856730 RepID=A0A423PV65_9GAMM|nr:TolC family outer membrane protein [Salinisphaera orenii]ROO29506.1 channel protein TolC [Salinisphaera orenii MK-B5]
MRRGARAIALALGAMLVLAGPAQAAQNLLDTYEQALRNDPDLLGAEAEAGAAGARYRRARGQLLPQLSASASYSTVTQDQTFERPENDGATGADFFATDDGATTSDQQSYSLDLTQPLFNWRAWQEKDAADAERAAARASLSVAEQDLIVRVARSYFDVLAARDALRAAREQRRSIRRQLDRAEAAYSAGLEPITDQQEARSSLDSAEVDAITAENELASARDALIALTGRSPSALSGIDVDTAVPEAESPAQRDREAWLVTALDRSPRIASARASWRAARQRIAAERGGHLPTVDLVGSIGRQEQLFPIGGGQANLIDETRSIGVQLQMPLFSGGATRAAVAEAEYEAEQARLDLIAARRQLIIDINDAWRDVDATRRRLAALERAIDSGRTALEAARAGYRLGNRTILDVIDAEITLVQRRADRKQAWYDHALARLELRAAAGVLGFDALARINARLHGAPAMAGDGARG